MRMSMTTCVLAIALLMPLGAQAEGGKPTVHVPEGGSIKLEYTNSPLVHVLEHLTQKTGMNFILPHRYSDQRITILSAEPVSFLEAFQALEAALGVERIIIKPVGKFALIARKPF